MFERDIGNEYLKETSEMNTWKTYEICMQEFWRSTSIAGLSNSAAAATPQRRVAWILVLALMIGAWVIFSLSLQLKCDNQDFVVPQPLGQEPELNYNINKDNQQGQGTQENIISAKIYSYDTSS